MNLKNVLDEEVELESDIGDYTIESDSPMELEKELSYKIRYLLRERSTEPTLFNSIGPMTILDMHLKRSRPSD